MTEPTIFPWQHDAWQRLQAMRERLPHALLFHGASGSGKTQFVEAFAQSLLCESVQADGRACGECVSCGWFAQDSHPDYRRVRPEALDDEGGEEGEGAEGEASSKKTKTKAPSRDIRIEQIRALADFMNISTHRRGLRVVVLYPAEALNLPSSNALLKTLEEPPPGTVFLLVSNSLDRLLPTILSRCRKFALPLPERAAALGWLQQQGVADAELLLAEQGGAPLAAAAHLDDPHREELAALLDVLAQPSTETVLKAADRLSKAPIPALVACQQRWLYDVLSYKLAGRMRYYPRYRAAIEKLAARVPEQQLTRLIARTNSRRAVAEHPLSAKLFVEDMLLDYTSSLQ
jgi:DNA polymerase-3 subunit delta'